MIKRIAAAALVTVVTAVGLAAPAAAVTSHQGADSVSIQRIIDWE